MKLPRRAAAPLAILVAVVLIATTTPANAATRLKSHDKVHDVKVVVKDKRNGMIDILDGLVNTKAGDGQHIRFVVHIQRAVGLRTFKDHPERVYKQNFVTTVRTDTDRYQITFKNFGDDWGSRIYLWMDGGYVDISGCTESGHVTAYAAASKRSFLSTKVPSACIKGSKIKRIGFYTSQTVDDGQPGHGEEIYASDALVRKVNVAIQR